MEQSEVVQVLTTKRKHKFYCDQCGEFLIETPEYDDGWYPEPEPFYWKRHKLKGHYCKKCGEKAVKEIEDLLKGVFDEN